MDNMGGKSPVKSERLKPIDSNLEELRVSLFETHEQLTRMSRSIDRIQTIEEEKTDRSDVKEKDRDFSSMSIHERILYLCEKANGNFRKLCYLNEKLEERV